MTWAVKLEGVSKKYRRGQTQFPSLRHELADIPARLWRRSRDVGTLALEGVDLTVEQGDSFALVGANGSGKSTLLRLISRISPPTAGRVRVRGRVGALLDVGSGIHPELSGRENVWLYGTVLGFSRAQIASSFDSIVAFAELEESIDTQVKYYSSGMQMRLGFSIAAHLDPAVLLVDEALAVGDPGFQVKCVDRMAKLVQEGRTLIFVSHSLPLVRDVCINGALLEAGRIVETGTAEDVVETFLDRVLGPGRPQGHESDAIHPEGLKVGRPGGMPITTGEALSMEVILDVRQSSTDCVISLGIGRANANLIMMSMFSTGQRVDLEAGRHTIRCDLPDLPLLPGSYEVHFSVMAGTRAFYYAPGQLIGSFFVAEGPPDRRTDQRWAGTSSYGPVHAAFDLIVD